GNTGSASFFVPVADTTPPSFSTPVLGPNEATSPNGAVVTYTNPVATDIVDGAVAVTCTPPSGSTFALGTTTVTCSSTAAHGNTASAPFEVKVVDTTGPAIHPPGGVPAEATSPNGAVVSYVAPATHDAVDGTGSASCVPASGSTFAIGATSVT